MPKHRIRPGDNLERTIKKMFLSAFVVFAFIAYVIHERLTNPGANLATSYLTPIVATHQAASQPVTAKVPPASLPLGSDPLITTSSPQLSYPLQTGTAQTQPQSTDVVQGLYKNGTYKGPEVDAYYGLVQVQATILGGKISDVQFLEFPSDRRTSVEINNIAVPYLQQEAIKAQSANVDIISGATLTSEAFILSLQNALNSAKN